MFYTAFSNGVLHVFEASLESEAWEQAVSWMKDKGWDKDGHKLSLYKGSPVPEEEIEVFRHRALIGFDFLREGWAVGADTVPFVWPLSFKDWNSLPILENPNLVLSTSTDCLPGVDGSRSVRVFWPTGLNMGVFPLGDGTCVWTHSSDVRTQKCIRTCIRKR